MALTEQSGWEVFRRDVGEACKVWSRHPGVAIVAIGLTSAACGVGGSTAIAMVGSLVAILATGFFGTQRLAYEAIRIGTPLDAVTLTKASGHYWGRFVRLGLLLIVFCLPLTIVSLALTSDQDSATAGPAWGFVVFSAVYLLVLDVLLTFATVELTFATDSASRAFRDGRRLLVRTWGHTKFHALIPPLVPLAVGQVVVASNIAAGSFLVVLGAAVAVIARGAHTSAYLRYRPIRLEALPSGARSVFRAHAGTSDRPDGEPPRRGRPVEEPDLSTINHRWDDRQRG